MGTFGEITLDKKISRYCPFNAVRGGGTMEVNRGRLVLSTSAERGHQQRAVYVVGTVRCLPTEYEDSYSCQHFFTFIL